MSYNYQEAHSYYNQTGYPSPNQQYFSPGSSLHYDYGVIHPQYMDVNIYYGNHNPSKEPQPVPVQERKFALVSSQKDHYEKPVIIGPVKPSTIDKLEAKIKNIPVEEQQHFPVSHGLHHKKDTEGYAPQKPQIPPEIMSKMAIAKSKLEVLPNDPHALHKLHEAMMEYQSFQQAKSQAHIEAVQNKNYGGPGVFTGEKVLEPMSKSEIDSDDVRTFARPDMFNNLKPLKENYGRNLMKKMGWQDGKPLGIHGKGSLTPIELTVKIDRKGLANCTEYVQRKPEGVMKNDGPQWICKIVNGKNPISGLGELHQAMGVPLPIFELTNDTAGMFCWTVKTSFGIFSSLKGAANKKIAKSQCAHYALKEILKNESTRLGLVAPIEANESHHLRVVFIPSTKSIGGRQLLYRHFYKGSNLVNIGSDMPRDKSPHLIILQPTPSQQPLTDPQKSSLPPSSSDQHNAHNFFEWVIDVVNGSDSITALNEICLRVSGKLPAEFSRWKYQQHTFTLNTHWGSHTCNTQRRNRKEARIMAYHHAISEIFSTEAKKLALPQIIETPESTYSNLSFVIPHR